jgi:hypothetical protein
MAFPVIAWRTILRNSGALVTASSSASGYPATNVKTFRAYEIWKANAVTSPQDIDIDLGASGSADADSIVLVNHNIVSNAGQVTVYADAVTIGTTTVQAAYSPTSDYCDLKTFTAPGAKRYWRVRFTDPAAPFASAPYCGVILLGLKMTMPEYVGPNDLDPYLHDIETVGGGRTQGGHAAGVILRGIPRRGTLRFGGDAGLVRSFLTSDFNSFLQTRYRRCEPWAFQLDSSDSDFARAYYLKKPIGAFSPLQAVGGTYGRFTVSLPFEEAQMEAA